MQPRSIVRFAPCLAVLALLLFSVPARAGTVAVSSLDLGKMEQEYGQPGVNVSVDKHPLRIGSRTYTGGIGSHSNSQLYVDLHKTASRFTASVGVDSEITEGGSVEFQVQGDGKLLWTSGVMRGGEPAREVSADLRGVGVLTLVVKDGGDGIRFDHADWAEATIEFAGDPPQAIPVPHRPAVILTPKPKPAPGINGPAVFGAQPGSPFLFSVAATGTRPMTFAAEGLPVGLTLDGATGRITGAVKQKGEYRVTLHARNALGAARRELRVIVGDEIALTPPMGWNSYNCWGSDVDQDKMLRSARALVAAGLDQHGWSYVNIDDDWQGQRGGPVHAIQPDPKRFSDLPALVNTVHGLGLKMGIYSTPWVVSYGDRLGGSSNTSEGQWDAAASLHAAKNNHTYPFDVGSHHFARSDARQFAAWNIDYLKYDWGPVDVANTREMEDALRTGGRDIVYSLSNNAAGNIFGIIGELSPHASAWRTTNDINDSWRNVSSIGFGQDKWAPFQRPGHYNDADMLVVGQVGWGHPHPTKLAPDEQYTHLSLWCLLGAPLLLGCDLEKLDDFTLGLLTNDEVLAVDQDALCKQATRVAGDEKLCVYAKAMADGSMAVGLFNRSGEDAAITANWADLKLSGRQRVRDLWRQQDLGVFADKFSASVPSHGVVLVRVFPAP